MNAPLTTQLQLIQGDAPLLTLDAVRALKAEHDDNVRLLAELPAQIDAQKRRLDAAMMFLPPGFDLDAAPGAGKPAVVPAPALDATPRRRTWKGETERVLKTLGRGVAHAELLDELRKTPELAEAERPENKGFYNAIFMLAKEGVLIKSGGLMFHKDVVSSLRTAGVPLPLDGPKQKPGSAAALVVAALEDRPKGLTPLVLKQIVGAHPEAPKSLLGHGQYIYNVLDGLVKNGAVSRRAGVYKLAKKVEKGMESNGA